MWLNLTPIFSNSQKMWPDQDDDWQHLITDELVKLESLRAFTRCRRDGVVLFNKGFALCSNRLSDPVLYMFYMITGFCPRTRVAAPVLDCYHPGSNTVNKGQVSRSSRMYSGGCIRSEWMFAADGSQAHRKSTRTSLLRIYISSRPFCKETSSNPRDNIIILALNKRQLL